MDRNLNEASENQLINELIDALYTEKEIKKEIRKRKLSWHDFKLKAQILMVEAKNIE